MTKTCPLTLKSLDNTTFWQQKLEEKLGVKSKASLDLLVGDVSSCSELEKEAKFLKSTLKNF